MKIVTDQCATMRAAIIKDMNLAVFGPADNHAFLADPSCPIVAGVGDLAFMADIDPRFVKNAFQLLLEYILVCVARFVDAIRLDK